jgi:hypothetical protein
MTPPVRIEVTVSPELEARMTAELSEAYEGFDDQRPEVLDVVARVMELLAVDVRDSARALETSPDDPDDGMACAMFLRALADALARR